MSAWRYALTEEDGRWVIRRADGSIAFSLSPEERRLAHTLFNRLLTGEGEE